MKYPMKNFYALWLANCVRETPADEMIPGDEALPGEDSPAQDEPAGDEPAAPNPEELTRQADDEVAQEENRDAAIESALAMYQTGQSKQEVCLWLAFQCPRSIETPEKAAKVLAGHNAGF